MATRWERRERYRESLRAALPLGDVIETSFEVQGVAMALAGNGDPETAPAPGCPRPRRRGDRSASRSRLAFWDALLERYLGPAPRAARCASTDEVWAEGRVLAFDDAVELALASRS